MEIKQIANRMPRLIRLPLGLLVFYLFIVLIFSSIYSMFGIQFSTPDLEVGSRSLGFIESLYVSVVTITTLGYGDFLPYSVGAKLLVSIEVLFGITIFGIFFVAIGMAVSKNQEHSISANAVKEEKTQIDYIYWRMARILNDELNQFDQNQAPIAMSGGGYYRFGRLYSVLARRDVEFSETWLRPMLGEEYDSTEQSAKTFADRLDKLDAAMRSETDRFGLYISDFDMIKLLEELSTTLNTQANILRRRSRQNSSHESLVATVLNDIRCAFTQIIKLRGELFSFSDGYIDGSDARYSIGRDPFDTPVQAITERNWLRKYFDL